MGGRAGDINKRNLGNNKLARASSVLKTERATNEILKDFENYADLLCYASLVEWRNENYTGADHYYEEAKAMWDGYGFADNAFDTNKFYATYKLGLFYFVNKMLGKSSFEFEKDLIQRVWLCQDINGGFKTDYYGDGSFPSCYTNTETTSIILLADFPRARILEIRNLESSGAQGSQGNVLTRF